MHNIEPYHLWRDNYISSEDKKSPFYRKTYNEFQYTERIYNYYIHPQWDNFGSATLYMKILYVDYAKSFAILEFIGEWNDCLHNDIMFLKRNIIDILVNHNIFKFVLLCDNVLNFHLSDDSYYEEWWDDIKDEDGWVCFVNVFDHVEDEMKRGFLQYYVNFGKQFNNVVWQNKNPEYVLKDIKDRLKRGQKQLF